MGVSDEWDIPKQLEAINFAVIHSLLKPNNIKKIALLGVQSHDHHLYRHCQASFPYAKIDIYDRYTDHGAMTWDLNSLWGIENYDLVSCHRTTCYIDNIENFISEFKKCLDRNKILIFDWSIYPQGLTSLKNKSLDIFDPKASIRKPPGKESHIDFRDLVPPDFKFQGSNYLKNLHWLNEDLLNRNGTRAMSMKEFFRRTGIKESEFRGPAPYVSPVKGIIHGIFFFKKQKNNIRR